MVWVIKNNSVCFWSAESMTSNISGKFVILDTEEEFLKNFSTAICKEINYRVNYKLNTLLQKSKQIVREILEACAFNIDVANGKLDADLGLRPSEGKSKMDAIIQMLVDEIDIQFRNFRFQSGRIEGGIDIFILEETYKNILASGHAIIITDNFDVLDWMIENNLFKGNTHYLITMIDSIGA